MSIGLFSEQVPPNSVEAEMAIIGACLTEPVGLMICLQEVNPDDFYSVNHRQIFEAIRWVDDRGRVDLITVAERLKDVGQLDKVGGLVYLTSCVNMCPTPSVPQSYIQRMKDKAKRRQLLTMALKVRSEALDEAKPIDEVTNAVQAMALNVNEPPVEDMTAELWVDMVEAEAAIVQSGQDGRRRVKTGISLIDNRVRMWPGRLTTIAADTGIGKSVFAIKFVRESVMRLNQRAYIWLGEMDREEFYERVFAAEEGIDYGKVQFRELTPEQLARMKALANRLDAAPLTIRDKPMTVSEIRADCRYIQHTKGQIDLVVIDYLTLLKELNQEAEGSDRRDVRIGIAVWNLIQLAKELECHVVLVHQFNRAKAVRAIGRPRVSDLKESSAIEQHSYNVLLLYRPDRDESLDPEDRAQYKGWMEVIIAKARGGKVGNVWLEFIGETQEIKNKFRPWPGEAAPGALPLPGSSNFGGKRGGRRD